MLRRLRDAWVYGGAVNEPMRARSIAKTVFDHHVDDARVAVPRGDDRNEQGTKTGARRPTTRRAATRAPA